MTNPVPPATGEPALILAVVSSAVALIITLNIGLTPEQGGLIVGLVTAVFAVVTAFATRPISPAIFSGVVTATFALLAGYHFHVSASTVGELNGLLTSLMMLIVRGHVSPVLTVRGTRA